MRETTPDLKYIRLTAPSPWLLQWRLKTFRCALDRRGGLLFDIQCTDDGETARAEVYYRLPVRLSA